MRALFQPVYACNPDDDSLQTRLAFLGGQGITPGGKVCVRSASGNRYEFRYSPPGNPGELADASGAARAAMLTYSPSCRSLEAVYRGDAGACEAGRWRRHVGSDDVSYVDLDVFQHFN